jgi:phosphopantothenoylcysteine synthetase/decarboxylase
VITAGGTREAIDDVRHVGNAATGELGHNLAEVYANLGFQVLLLAAGDVFHRFGTLQGVNHQVFTSAESLQEQLLAIGATRLVLQSAAVSDYTPFRAEGKLSSDNDELTIHMRRTAKILPQLRNHFGPTTSLVGFKLLSGVSEKVLVDTAHRQIETCRTDFCVANDLSEINTRRRIHIVHPDGNYQTHYGSVPDLAVDISKSIPVPG